MMLSELVEKSLRHTGLLGEMNIESHKPHTSPSELQECLSWLYQKCSVSHQTPMFQRSRKSSKDLCCLHLWKAGLQMEWPLSLALSADLLMKGDEHPSWKINHGDSSCQVVSSIQVRYEKATLKKQNKNKHSNIYCI